MPDIPAGNIPIAIRLAWLRFWQRLGLKRPHSRAEVAQVAAQLRVAFEQLVEAA